MCQTALPLSKSPSDDLGSPGICVTDQASRLYQVTIIHMSLTQNGLAMHKGGCSLV